MIRLTLPIYRIKNKKGEKMLIGMNQIIGMKNFMKNKIKQEYQHVVLYELEKTKQKPISGVYEVQFTLYPPHSRMDVSNVCSMVDKYVLDAMQSGGYVENDNVNHYKKATYKIGEKDKDNPRVEILVKNIREKK